MDADIGVQVCNLAYMKGHVAHVGFPEVAYGKEADKLVRAGYKVARVEQTETPEQLKERKKKHKGKGAPKVVNREVCSVMTTGTRTFCFLDSEEALADDGTANGGLGPLLSIREVLVEASEEEEEVQPVCEYGITLVDAVRGTVTIGQFADDALRSRMTTLLTAFGPSEVREELRSGRATLVAYKCHHPPGLTFRFAYADSLGRRQRRCFTHSSLVDSLPAADEPTKVSDRNYPPNGKFSEIHGY
jgi:DNA mismatch repair protein MSH6